MKAMVAGCVVAVVLCGCAAIPTAEDPCSGVQTYTDDFGKTTRGLILYFDNAFRASGLLVEEGRHVMRALFVLNGVSDTAIPAGTPAKVALVDGTVMELSTAKISTPVAGANPGNVFTQWAVDFELTSDQLDKLKNSALKAIQIQIASLELLVRLDERNGNAMRYLAQCLGT
jgi:hypothetical protein